MLSKRKNDAEISSKSNLHSKQTLENYWVTQYYAKRRNLFCKNKATMYYVVRGQCAEASKNRL